MTDLDRNLVQSSSTRALGKARLLPSAESFNRDSVEMILSSLTCALSSLIILSRLSTNSSVDLLFVYT